MSTPETEAQEILRDIIEGDDATMDAALERGRVLLEKLRTGTPPKRVAARNDVSGAQRLQAIVELTAKHYGFTTEQLVKQNRQAEVVLPRQVAMWLCRRVADAKLDTIGRVLERHHGTVMHALQSVDNRREADLQFNATLQQLREEAARVCGKAAA